MVINRVDSLGTPDYQYVVTGYPRSSRVVAVPGQQAAAGFRIWPDVSASRLNAVLAEGAGGKLHIYSATGKSIFSTTVTNVAMQLPLPSAAGVYFCVYQRGPVNQIRTFTVMY
jgi:hypothetical protein